MADKVTAKNTDAKFKTHDEGQFVAQLMDVIDMGEVVITFPGSPDYLAQKCVLVFRTGEKNPDNNNEYIDVSSEFTVSMGEKANLRKFLQQWRGKPYTQEEADAGVPLDKLDRQWALLTVAHKTSQKGRTYAIIVSAVGVPKQMRDGLVDYTNYKRAKFWDEKKAEYAKATKLYRAEINAPPHGSTQDDMPTDTTDYSEEGAMDDDQAYSGDDDLPF